MCTNYGTRDSHLSRGTVEEPAAAGFRLSPGVGMAKSEIAGSFRVSLLAGGDTGCPVSLLAVAHVPAQLFLQIAAAHRNARRSHM